MGKHTTEMKMVETSKLIPYVNNARTHSQEQVNKGGTAELNTALGILANNGIKGAEGGTHLRNIILSLQNPTDKAAGSLKQLGVSVYDSEGNMRSMGLRHRIADHV